MTRRLFREDTPPQPLDGTHRGRQSRNSGHKEQSDDQSATVRGGSAEDRLEGELARQHHAQGAQRAHHLKGGRGHRPARTARQTMAAACRRSPRPTDGRLTPPPWTRCASNASTTWAAPGWRPVPHGTSRTATSTTRRSRAPRANWRRTSSGSDTPSIGQHADSSVAASTSGKGRTRTSEKFRDNSGSTSSRSSPGRSGRRRPDQVTTVLARHGRVHAGIRGDP